MARLSKHSVARRPIGWRNDSYRHYLAAKGVCTNRFVHTNSNRYFSNNDFLKGNRNDPADPHASLRKSLNAQGYNSSEQERIFNIPRLPKKSSALIDVPDRDAIGMADRPVMDSSVMDSSTVAELPQASIEVEAPFPEEQLQQLPVETPLEDKTVSELTAKEKRQLMDQLQTKGIPEPPPSFSTPGVAEMPPSSPFSQNELVTTPAQAPFLDGSGSITTVTRPLVVKRKPKTAPLIGLSATSAGSVAPQMFSLKTPLGDLE